MNAAATFELHGVRVRLESELPAFVEYARVALAPWSAQEDDLRFDIRSVLEWREAPAPRGAGEGSFAPQGWTRRPDRDLYVAESRAWWLRIDDFPDLQVQVDMSEDCLELHGRYFFHLAAGAAAETLQRLRFRSNLDELRARRFSTLLYYLFYHPLLWWLSRGAGWHALHAGAVATPIGAVVLAGMPGCGKSSLSVAMLADKANRMLSDNLVLHDGSRVMACPEVLLLDERSLRMVGPAAARLAATGEKRVYSRDAYRVAEVEPGPCDVAALIHVERAAEFVFRPIEPSESAARLRAANTMAKEVRRIGIMNEVLDVVSGARRLDEHRAADTLSEAAPSFELRVPEVDDLVGLARDRVLAVLLEGLGGAAA